MVKNPRRLVVGHVLLTSAPGCAPSRHAILECGHIHWVPGDRYNPQHMACERCRFYPHETLTSTAPTMTKREIVKHLQAGQVLRIQYRHVAARNTTYTMHSLHESETAEFGADVNAKSFKSLAGDITCYKKLCNGQELPVDKIPTAPQGDYTMQFFYRLSQ